ncbi:MAG: aldo/keto reductase [Planctomycetota bacterium]
MTAPLRWAILGPGGIAQAFSAGVQQAQAGTITAVGSRSLARAQAFIDSQGLADATPTEGYDALLDRDDVDAVYIATPHTQHAQWCIRALEAGKHVFCEKPAALNAPSAERIADTAERAGLLFVEAFKERSHPQTHKLLELLRDRVIGEVQLIRSNFAFRAGINPEGRLFNPMLAGGGLLDVGCYATNMARLIAGTALNPDNPQPFAHPTEVKAQGHLGGTGVDEWATMLLDFGQGLLAQCTTGVRLRDANDVHITGTEGSIHLPDPWINDRADATDCVITLKKTGQEPERISVPSTMTAFAYEAADFARLVAEGKTGSDPSIAPVMSHADTISNLRVLDACRQEIGLVYPHETPEHNQPDAGRTPQARPGHAMTYAEIPGLDRPISRFVFGCDNKNTLRDAAPIWDHFIEAGGNAFDTAMVYGRKRQRIMGGYLRSRGIADKINLICKGAHTPNCNPDALTRELHESLEDFGLDRVPIYIMHRDNPDVPVGEFVDVLHEHAEAGRIGIFGGSNWSPARIDAANAYADQHGKRRFGFTSNNFSLARMVHPVWNGCIAASTDEHRQWHTDTQTPNFAWSSQARGYFVSREGQNYLVTHVDSWDSPDNRQRRDRAFELAEQFGVSAINIAAAYVLCQPFPQVALIGPRHISETTSSLPALGVELSPQQLAYLDLRADAPG